MVVLDSHSESSPKFPLPLIPVVPRTRMSNTDTHLDSLLLPLFIETREVWILPLQPVAEVAFGLSMPNQEEES